MTVAFGYTLRDNINKDEIIKKHIYESYKKLAEKDEDSYYANKKDIDISPIFINVKTVGEVYHGIRLKVPNIVDLEGIIDRLKEIMDTYIEYDEINIWTKKIKSGFEIYIECETIIKNIIDKYGELDYNQNYDDLYNLYESKK